MGSSSVTIIPPTGTLPPCPFSEWCLSLKALCLTVLSPWNLSGGIITVKALTMLLVTELEHGSASWPAVTVSSTLWGLFSEFVRMAVKQALRKKSHCQTSQSSDDPCKLLRHSEDPKGLLASVGYVDIYCIRNLHWEVSQYVPIISFNITLLNY